jgi:hypothetical protein
VTWRASVLALALAGCGGPDEAVIDAQRCGDPDDATVHATVSAEPRDGATVTASVEGGGSRYEVELPRDEALRRRVEIAVLYDGAEIAAYSERLYLTCDDDGCLSPVIDSFAEICVMPSGEIRWFAWSEPDCVVDAFCEEPPCRLLPDSCASDRRCGGRWLHADLPTAARACVPVGAGAEGDACTWGPPGQATGHDSCGRGLICVDATCRRLCESSCEVGTCEPVAALDGASACRITAGGT